MRKHLTVLLLVHAESLPPASIDGLSDTEIHAFKVEFDVQQALLELGHRVITLGIEDELKPLRRAIGEHEPDIVFNLLMSFHNIGIYDAHVVSYLELLKTTYTGANPRGILLASDKALSKKILTYHRIQVPDFVFFSHGHTPRPKRRLPYPMFVKSDVEHASLGIAQASIVTDEKALLERVDFIHRTLGTNAIAEQYIAGRELNVGVLGNDRLKVLPIWELSFGNLPRGTRAIATHKMKWDLEYQAKVGLSSGPANDLDDGTTRKIHNMAKRIYRALGLSGFARIDLRVADDGRIYVLEANPNPDLCYGEDLAEAAAMDGIDYPHLIQRILNLGLAYRPPWKMR